MPQARFDGPSKRRRRRAITRLIALALVAGGLVLFGLKEQPVRWPSTVGTVGSVGIDASTGGCAPVVAYTVDHQQYSFVDPSSSTSSFESCSLSQGQTVTVRYDPAQPWQGFVADAGSNEPKHFYLVATVLLVAGVLVALFGTFWDRRQLQAASGQRSGGGVVVLPNTDRGRPVIRYGGIDFEPPRKSVRAFAYLRVAACMAFGLWALVGSWRQQPVISLFTFLVFVELALSTYRSSQFAGDVIVPEAQALRVSMLVREVFSLAHWPPPRVVLKDQVSPSASVRSTRGTPQLVLSTELLDKLSDRQLRALVAHEAEHLVLGDTNRARRHAVVLLLVLLAGTEAAIFTIGPSLLPTYLAVVFTCSLIARVPIGLMNRRRETRADIEGARLVRDPAGMASMLETAYRYNNEYRSAVSGDQPWRTLLWPLSWRPPSHPPMERRLATLAAMATESGW